MAKSRKKKKTKKPLQRSKIKPENYIRKHARKLPIYECLIRDDWKEVGLSPVVVSRQRSNGNFVAGTYIVDLQCLGVKDTSYIYDIDPYSYQENIRGMGEGMDINFIKIDPTLAFNIIYGAVEFAEDCGFEPHKDFTKITEFLLDHVESIEYMDIHFGDEDGKPLFFAGPYDDSNRILATLTKHVGEGNFKFIADTSNFFDEDDYYDDANSLMSRKEIKDTFLPDEKVNQKIKTLEIEEQKAAFLPQIICAGFILEELEGQLHLLETTYETEENFFLDILEKLANSFATSEGVNIEDIEEDVMDELAYLTTFMIEKLIDFESTDFLFEADYTAIPRVLSEEQLANMSKEELDLHQEHVEFYMTKDEKYHHIIREYAYYFLSVNHSETDFSDTATQAKVIDEFIAEAKSQNELVADLVEDYREGCQRVIDVFFLEKE